MSRSPISSSTPAAPKKHATAALNVPLSATQSSTGIARAGDILRFEINGRHLGRWVLLEDAAPGRAFTMCRHPKYRNSFSGFFSQIDKWGRWPIYITPIDFGSDYIHIWEGIHDQRVITMPGRREATMRFHQTLLLPLWAVDFAKVVGWVSQADVQDARRWMTGSWIRTTKHDPFQTYPQSLEHKPILDRLLWASRELLRATFAS